MKKKIIGVTAAFVLAASPFNAGADGAAVKVTVNGEAVTFTDAFPFADENGRTLVPLRAAADALGLDVEWRAEAKTAVFKRTYTLENAPEEAFFDYDGDGENDRFTGSLVVRFTADSARYALVRETYSAKDGTAISSWRDEGEMDTAAALAGDRMYAPIRYLANQFDYDVLWDGETNTVKILPAQRVYYHYFYSDKEDLLSGVLSLGVANDGGIADAAITRVGFFRELDTPRPYSDLHVYGEPLAFEKGAEQKLFDEAAAGGYTFLDDVRVNHAYTFESGSRNVFQVTFKGTKTNGADFEHSFFAIYDFDYQG
jgi:hypothetical protein